MALAMRSVVRVGAEQSSTERALARTLTVLSLGALCGFANAGSGSGSGSGSGGGGGVTYSPASLPWSFSFDTLSTFAFPGCASRFATDAEVAYFEENFDSMLIWGLNASCRDGSVPVTRDSTLYCNQSSPETQLFELTMETSLQEQGRRLKAQRTDGSYFPVFGYIESLSAQQYYANHAPLLYDPAFASWRLSVGAPGLIDCYRDGCNWQGTEYRQWDLRQQVVRDYYVSNVIGGLVNGSGLDGTFLDVIDWWADSCATWSCSDQERDDLISASLLTLEALLLAYPNKVFSVSSHTSLLYNTEYYIAQLGLLKASGNGVRFWEFFKTEDIPSLIYETAVVQVPVHVHVTARTLSPDWVELAAVLMGYSSYTYFSFSGPWMLDSFNVFPEFTKPLGKPLGPAVSVPASNTSFARWAQIPSLNVVDNFPKNPDNSSDVFGELAFLGLQTNFAACMALVAANSSFTGMTYVINTAPPWYQSCWGRLDNINWQACISSPNGGPPCYTAIQPGNCISAVNVAVELPGKVQWTRSFEHLDVTLTVDPSGADSATLAWH